MLDPNAALIPNVELTLVNDETAVARSTVSNAAGEYSFANVQPGVYTLSADLEGFSPFVAEGLTIGISTFLVSDITLNVGGVRGDHYGHRGNTPLSRTAQRQLPRRSTASRSRSCPRRAAMCSSLP